MGWNEFKRGTKTRGQTHGNVSPKNSMYVNIEYYNSLISKFLGIITKMLFNFNEHKKQFYWKWDGVFCSVNRCMYPTNNIKILLPQTKWKWGKNVSVRKFGCISFFEPFLIPIFKWTLFRNIKAWIQFTIHELPCN